MKSIAFLSMILFASNTFAQFTDTTVLDPVEVKATRASATAPFAKTNLGKSYIQRQNLGQDLPFLLNQTPSVVVHSDAGNGVGYTGIRIRGTDATRINVTLNGVPFNDAEGGGTFFVNLPDFSSSVQSIQVQRGVGTSTNGSSAFGANINLSTNEINKLAYAEVNNSYGSFNTWKNTLKAGTGLLGDHFTTDVRLSNITSDGFIDRANSDLKSFYFTTAYLASNTSLRLNIFSGKEKTYQAWYGVSEEDLKTNRRINYAGTEKPGSPYDNETDNYKQDHYQLIFNQNIGRHLVFSNTIFLVKGKGFYEQYKAGEDYAAYGLPDKIVGPQIITTTDVVRQLWLDNDYYGNVFSLQWKKEKTDLLLGGVVTNYNGKHFGEVIWASNGMNEPTHRWYDLNATKTDYSVYTKVEQRITNGLTAFTDLQYRNVQYDLNGFRNNPAIVSKNRYGFFNPKLGLTYVKNNFTAYASYSIANKEPNRDDFEAGLLQQPKPERLNDFEAGIENKSAKWNWAANLYYMQYRNQLVLTGMINDVGAYTRTNIPRSYRLGVEVQGGVAINRLLSASANIAISKNKIKNFTEYIDDYDNGGQKTNQYNESDIAFSPAVVSAFTITMLPVKQLSIDLIGKYVGKQYLDNTASNNRKLNGWYTQDAKAIYSFSNKAVKNVSIIFGVNNLFNKNYQPNGYTFSYYYNNALTTENFYLPMAGRTWIAGVQIKI